MISTCQLRKTYYRGTESVEALRGIDLDIEKGKFIVILGPSGGGKSTLLNLLGGIDHPSSGSIVINGFALEKASEEELTRFRRDHVGYIFQFYNLLSALNAIENVALPLMARGESYKSAKIRAVETLHRVGLENRLKHRPAELSGGEQQRVAIARSIIMKPAIILADEPTGDLDSVSAHETANFLKQLNHELGITIIMATHNQTLVETSDEIYELSDGLIHKR